MSTAVVVEAPGEHRLASHEPRRPEAGEALVRVHAVGICGSDREVYQGNRPEGYVRYPLTPGHEWSGTVEAVGAGVPATLVGRKVVGEGFRNCQVCDRCHAGETTLCTAGYEETGFTQPGAMAATLTLPARLLHVLPDEADLTAAALLEPAACIAAAALKANARPGERVAVVGTGTLGMFAVQFLKAGSSAELLVVGSRPDRAALSEQFGATGFRTKNEPLPDDFDVVIETHAAPRTRPVPPPPCSGGADAWSSPASPRRAPRVSTRPISSYGSWRCTPSSGRRRTPGRTRSGSSARGCSIRSPWSPMSCRSPSSRRPSSWWGPAIPRSARCCCGRRTPQWYVGTG